jgi:hypothetical protein
MGLSHETHVSELAVFDAHYAFRPRHCLCCSSYRWTRSREALGPGLTEGRDSDDHPSRIGLSSESPSFDTQAALFGMAESRRCLGHWH